MSTLYVDAEIGTASGPGTEAAPYSTITLAHAAATAGDTLRIRGGGTRLYREQVTVTKQLTLTGYGSAEPRIIGSVARTGWTLDSGDLWYVSQATDPFSIYFVTSAGLYVKGSRKTTAAACVAAYDFAWIDASDRLYVYAEANPTTVYARVEMCSLDYGIHADGVNGIVVADVHIYGVRGVGIDIDNATSFTARDFIVGMGGGDGMGGQNCLSFAASDFLIHDIGATRPATAGEIGAEGDGHSLHGTSSCTLERGIFRDCLKAAINSIETTTTTANRIRVERCNANVLGFHTTGTLTLRNSLVIMADDDLGGVGTLGTTVLENVGIYGAGTAAGDSEHNIGLTTYGTTTFRNLWITNCRVGWSHVLGTTTQGRAAIAGNGTDVSGTTLGAAVLTTAPTFVNAAGEDFRLAAGSVAIAEGVSLAASFTDDLGGRRRGTLWDIGPFAYALAPREAALAGLCDALSVIGDPDEGDWETDAPILAVHREGLAEDGARVQPCISLVRVAETMTRAGYSGTAALYDRTMTIDAVYDYEGWASGTVAGAILSDVESAIGSDRTLGGVVTDCHVIQNEARVDGEALAVSFTIVLRYRTSDATPTLRV